MYMNLRIACILVFIFISVNITARAQTDPAQGKGYPAYYKMQDNVRKFYEIRQYKPAWIGNAESLRQLITFLSAASSYGLDSVDYHFALKPVAGNDSMLLDIRLSGLALQFLEDVAYGSEVPAIGYNGLGYTPVCYDMPLLLNAAANSKALQLLVDAVQPLSQDYLSIKRKMNQWQQMIAAPAFRDGLVTSTSVSSANRQLVKRLWQLGILDSIPAGISVLALRAYVKRAQHLFNMVSDGYIKVSFLNELNVPLKRRIAELKFALNTFRWLNCAKMAGPVIIVNIPSATLLVYENNRVVLESRIVVGKKSTRTPTLTSKVNEVILYPYWMVPGSIATKELLPMIKRNTAYLDMNNMQVLNKQGRVVNPRSINWNELNAANFPYVIRQSTGCDNSLGIVKLNFYNPYHVYLHDTPWKMLFSANKRYFSHGCMRVEKAMEVAHLLLKGNTIAVDTLEEKGCIRNQSPIIVPASVPMPVFVLYSTAWTDSAGVVSFNEDVYGRLNLKK
jgi:L,D-transpeptidase YcbB